MAKPDRVVAAARQKLLDERAKRDEWTITRDAATRDLEALQATAGDALLDDPSAAQSVPRRMQELRDRIETADRAIAAAEVRVDAAQASYLTAEADALEPSVAEAEKALEQHERRTLALLEELRTHEGVFVPETPGIDMVGEAGALWKTGEALPVRRSTVLEGRVEELRRPVQILREMAAGRDPQRLVVTWRMPAERVYPACVWGPTALVPAPVYLSRLDAVRARRDELAAKTLPEHQTALERAEQALSTSPDPKQKQQTNGVGNPTLADRVHGARHHLAQTAETLRRTEDELAQLTGKR